MKVQAEVSLYPLGEREVLPAILELIRGLEAEPGLTVEPGPLSTLVSGDCATVFEALGRLYAAAGAEGRRILVVKVVNGGRPARKGSGKE